MTKKKPYPALVIITAILGIGWLISVLFQWTLGTEVAFPAGAVFLTLTVLIQRTVKEDS